jgi:hypothetical protein
MKLPIINNDDQIAYDVPYVYMEEGQDCWEAALLMLYKFVGGTLRLDKSFNDQRTLGFKPESLGEVLPQYLKPHATPPSSKLGYHRFLALNGPALVVLSESRAILHAQVLVGMIGQQVLLNNPDRNFLTADLSASGPFIEIEKSIVERYGGKSFEQWQGTQADNNNNSAPLAALHISPQISPVPSPPPSQIASPVVLRHARPGTPMLPLSSLEQQSPFHTPPASPPRSRSPSLDESKSIVSSHVSPAISPPASPSPLRRRGGPSLPDSDLGMLRAELERTLGRTGGNVKRKYIQSMEDQALFRKHRSMELTKFQYRMLNEKGLAPLWTLRGG